MVSMMVEICWNCEWWFIRLFPTADNGEEGLLDMIVDFKQTKICVLKKNMMYMWAYQLVCIVCKSPWSLGSFRGLCDPSVSSNKKSIKWMSMLVGFIVACLCFQASSSSCQEGCISLLLVGVFLVVEELCNKDPSVYVSLVWCHALSNVQIHVNKSIKTKLYVHNG